MSSKQRQPQLFRYRGEIGLALLCLFLFFWRLGAARLFDMDEGFYVSCARQMIVSHDYITPKLNFRPHDRPWERAVPFFEKPILTYWAAAGTMRLFGATEGAARLPVATASLAATLIVVLVGRRWIGPRAGLLAGLVYATAPMIVLDGRQMTTDALLTLWFLIAMVAYRERRPILFAAACGVGVLTKGIVALILPMLVIFVEHVARGCWAGWHGRPFRWWPMPTARQWTRIAVSAIVFAGIAAPWHIAVLKAGGQDAMGRTWVQEYIVRQHIGRFKGLDVHHNAPIVTYFGYFLIGFFPWACFTPFAFRFPERNDPLAATCMPRPNDLASDTRRFLLCWFWTVFGFFSLSAAKLPTYIVPAYPAAALMVGQWLDIALKRRRERPEARTAAAPQRMQPVTSQIGAAQSAAPGAEAPGHRDARRTVRGLRIGSLVALITAVLLLVATLITPALTVIRPVMPPAIGALATLLTLVLSIGCLLAWLSFRRSARGPLWILGGIWLLAGAQAAIIGLVAGPGYNLINRWLLRPYQDLAIDARADAAQGRPVVYYDFGDRRPSMLFYAGDYSPLERKETPLVPFLSRYLPPGGGPAAIITLRKSFEQELRAELDAAHWTVDGMVMHDSGLDTWLLLRIRPPKPPAAQQLPEPAAAGSPSRPKRVRARRRH